MYFPFYLTLTLTFCFLINENKTNNKAKELLLLSVALAPNAQVVQLNFFNPLCFLKSSIFAIASLAQVVLLRKKLLRPEHKLNSSPFCSLANEKQVVYKKTKATTKRGLNKKSVLLVAIY